jgi:RimJ/RimL family protein N-acetyltransferase
MNAPVLQTERLRLRPFASADVDVLHGQWTDPDVRRYLWDGRVIARDEVVAVVDESVATFARGGSGFWVIELGAPAVVIGFVGLRSLPDASDLELYYGLAPRHWGHGYATEASRAVLRYGFDVLGLEAIAIRTDGPNAASIAVMERLGARYLRTDPTGAFGTTIVYVAEAAACETSGDAHRHGAPRPR